MPDIRIKDLPSGTPNENMLLAMDLTTTAKATIKDVVYAGRPAASQSEAVAGTNPEKVMTPVATKQSIASEIGVSLASYAQGALASTALQTSNVSTVALSGQYSDLLGKPTLGTAAAQDSTAFATAAQGTKADNAMTPITTKQSIASEIGVSLASAAQGLLASTALQTSSVSAVALSGQYSDLLGKPTLGTAAAQNSTAFATSAQGTKADNAVPNTRTVAGKTLSSDVTLSKADVGLGNVDNTSDVDKPVSTAQAAADDLRLLKTGGDVTGEVRFIGDAPFPVINSTTGNYAGLRVLNAAGRWDVGIDPEGKWGFFNYGAGGSLENIPFVFGNDGVPFFNQRPYFGAFNPDGRLITFGEAQALVGGGGGGGGTVTSVFGRTGPLIDAQTGDYSIGQITGAGTAAPLNVGRGIGNVLRYEDFGGVPTLYTDGYMMFRQSNPGPEDFANVAIYRDTGTSFGSGTLGNTNSNLIVRTDVRSNTNAFQWNALFQLQVHPGLTRTSTTGQNEPLALGVTLRKQSDIVAWALYSSIEDFTVNPVYATIGWEFGFKANLADPNKRRVVVDMQLNSIDDTPGYTKYGDNEIATVFNITPSLNESDRVIVEKVFRITGRIGVGIDMSGMKKAVYYGTNTQYYPNHDLECIALPNGGNIVYRNGENGPIVGGLSYNSAIGNGAFAITGQTVADESDTGGRSLLLSVNGVNSWVPLLPSSGTLGSAAVKNTGRNVGNVVQYESFIGSDIQGIGVRNNSSLWIRKDNDPVANFATLWLTREVKPDSDRTGNVFGGTSAALRIDATVDQLEQEMSQWPLTVTLKYLTRSGEAGNAQHVAGFIGIDKYNPSAFMWAMNIGVRDYFANPTKGTVGVELTMAVRGTDVNGQRFGLHIAGNSAGLDGAPDSTPGVNGIYAALVMGGPAANVQYNRMVKLEGTAKVVLDASNVSFESGDVMMRMTAGHKLQWGAYGNMESAPNGQIAWFPSIQTFGIDGMKSQFSAGSLVGYKVIQFDGTELCIPVYAKT